MLYQSSTVYILHEVGRPSTVPQICGAFRHSGLNESRCACQIHICILCKVWLQLQVMASHRFELQLCSCTVC